MYLDVLREDALRSYELEMHLWAADKMKKMPKRPEILDE